MAAKHGAHSRLKAQKAMIAAARSAHHGGEGGPGSGVGLSRFASRLVRMPTVATTFSLATRPVMEVTVACQFAEAQTARRPGSDDGAQARHQAVLRCSCPPRCQEGRSCTFVEAEVHQEPDHNRGQEDDGTGFDDVALHTLPRGHQHRACTVGTWYCGSSMMNGVASPAKHRSSCAA